MKSSSEERINRLNREFATVCRRMHLRRPQEEAIRAFHELMCFLPQPLPDVSENSLVNHFRDRHPHWSFESDFPELTFALATGVGKTRLMGALMAYLFRSGEAKNFLILAPRSTIVDKTYRELQVGHSKYIFVDPQLVDQPKVVDSQSMEFAHEGTLEFSAAPTVWILSPQSIARSRSQESLRFHRKSEFTGQSPGDLLAHLDDLVVFFDESHHLGDSATSDPTVWRTAIRDLNPRLMFEMTASPRDGVNVLSSYDLQECLRDALYTKSVRLIAEKRTSGIDDWDWDLATLRQGLELLASKQRALDEFSQNADFASKTGRAVALVCAKDIPHAQEIADWLSAKLGPEAVLLVHSELGEQEYLDRLLSVEDPDSSIQVVVNVFQLTEGWDVTNVFVIVPLRAMATVTGVIQTMGRGLRLPFGERTGDLEVDSLDVLCYGRHSMSEIVDEVISEGFGSDDDSETYIKVEPPVDPGDVRKFEDYTLQPVKEFDKTLPNVDWLRPRVDLRGFSLDDRAMANPQVIDLKDPRTQWRLQGAAGFTRPVFVDLVTTLVLGRRQRLGSVTDHGHLAAAIGEFLDKSGLGESDLVSYSPEFVAKICLRTVDGLLQSSVPVYEVTDGTRRIKSVPITVKVPEGFAGPFDCRQRWSNALRRVPIGNWTRCAYEAITVDSFEEFHVAKLLDQSPEVEWWARNVRQIFSLATPAGNYAPDFLFILQVDNKNVLLEVKGEHLASGSESESLLKSRAAEIWCRAISEATSSSWEHWLVVSRDASSARDLQDLKSAADDWKSLS